MLNRPRRSKSQPSRRSDFTLIESLTLIAVIGVLAAVTVPGFMRPRPTCQANLSGLAVRMVRQ
jgi:type II secretory pathway pseudopilin PulG